MKKVPKFLFITIATFTVGVCSVAGWLYYRESQRIEVSVPNAHWEPLFFKTINKTTELAGVPELRKTVVGEEDVEVRFWHGFGLSNLEGVILRRNAGRWSAFHIEADDYIEPHSATIKQLSPPKSGMESLWNKLNTLGLLTLPDASEIHCDVSVIDGESYVVEINQNHKYRTYRYSYGECQEAALVETMDMTIGGEFATKSDQCTRAEWFGCARFRLSVDTN